MFVNESLCSEKDVYGYYVTPGFSEICCASHKGVPLFIALEKHRLIPDFSVVPDPLHLLSYPCYANSRKTNQTLDR